MKGGEGRKARVILCHTPRELDDIIITRQCVESEIFYPAVYLTTYISPHRIEECPKNLDVLISSLNAFFIEEMLILLTKLASYFSKVTS